MRAVLLLLAAVSLSACATAGDRASLDQRDPYEGFNRGVWAFNDAVDTVAIKPVTTVYRTVTPVPARRGIGRIFANLGEPFSFINNLLQGKPDRALNTLGRFLINSTIGIGGLADHATDLGLPPTREDFGQTLAVAGARKSPYLVLPILGPSTIRDAIGTGVQFAADPSQILLSEVGANGTERAGVTALRVVDQRSQVMDSGYEAVLETSADPYASARSAYFQRREAQILDQEASPTGPSAADEERILNEALEQDAVPEGSEAVPDTGATTTPQDPATPPVGDPKE